MYYTCPFCGHDQTVDEPYVSRGSHILREAVKGVPDHEYIGLQSEFVACRNASCGRYSLSVTVYPAERNRDGTFGMRTPRLLDRRLVPESVAEAWPEYVPAHLRDAYEKACLIVDLAPEASATMSRRCLQGLIRDRWPDQMEGLAYLPRLVDEINALKGHIGAQSWSAIDAVRGVGNIGAHFETDIDRIVEVEANEAAMLIKLLELLVKEWYVQRHENDELLRSIQELGEQKEAERRGIETRTATASGDSSADTGHA